MAEDSEALENYRSILSSRQRAELRRDRASKRLRAANDELMAAESEYGAASRDLECFENDAKGKP